MQQLVYFLQRYKNFLFFLFLEIIAVALIINNHSFHRSKFISSTNFITGGLYEKSSEISEYLNLKDRNITLTKENKILRNKLEKLYALVDSTKISFVVDSLHPNQQYKYINGKITNNSYNKANNFITINQGVKNGVSTEMAVINSKGIIGITDNASNKYARVQSILNSKSRINASFKNNNHFGTLTWDGKDYNTVQLTDIPRQAIFKVGDTIITGGKSTIFPKGIPIGTILEVPENLSASNTINIKLFNDMSNLGHIYIIINLNKKEIKTVENKNE
ncbi:rod shape-determining protein MreC [uncultured Tenacibaculum sp.]|uniref:rod shape-determining protein MreC n=1 Tax=uncultured Tenacibaculum sp. TaxID=174713 RepID=UPI0026069338|nr:rod shape-determining protein MreC [uncultured Tenacibaculum sp.]